MPDEDGADSRSEKLQERFGSISSEASETSGSSEASKAPDAGGTSEASGASKAAGETALRDRPTQLLYLEEDFLEELELSFGELNLRFQREHGEELEKNRHWYPRLLALGLEQVGDVRERDLEELEDVLGLE